MTAQLQQQREHAEAILLMVKVSIEYLYLIRTHRMARVTLHTI
jgi:hypothetical protein